MAAHGFPGQSTSFQPDQGKQVRTEQLELAPSPFPWFLVPMLWVSMHRGWKGLRTPLSGVPGTHEGQKRVLGLLELELQMEVNHPVSAENLTWDFCKSSQASA